MSEASALAGYKALVKVAVYSGERGASLSSDHVYGQARKIDSYQISPRKNNGRRYTGAFRVNVRCVDVAGGEKPPGLRGQLVRFRCNRDPGVPRYLGGMSGAHGGQYAVLRKDVECSIEYPLEPGQVR